jgi:hypothetical protein
VSFSQGVLLTNLSQILLFLLHLLLLLLHFGAHDMPSLCLG